MLFITRKKSTYAKRIASIMDATLSAACAKQSVYLTVHYSSGYGLREII